MTEKRVVYYLCTILVMTIIFLFSSQGSTTTYKTSGKIVTPITNQIKKHSDKSFESQKKETAYWKNVKLNIEKFTRKIAHIFLFTIFSGCVYLTLTTYPLSKNKIFILTFAFCILYGGIDEFHQYFVKGRTSTITDVFIDSIGALLVIGFCYTKEKLSKKINR